MSLLVLRITESSTSPLITGNLGLVVANKPLTTLENLKNLFQRFFVGSPSLASATMVPNTTSVRCDVSPVAATGTYTLSSSSGTLHCVINGVDISDATGGTDTANAAALVVKINANATLSPLVLASNVAGVITVTAIGSAVGLSGNCITTTGSGTGNTCNQTRLTGGTDGTAQVTAAKASGTFTCATCSGAIVANINGQSVTVTSTGVDADDAVLMTTAILASEKVGIRGVVTATSALGVVTVTALAAGTPGNGVTTTASGTGFTAGQAKLSGGLEAVSTRFSY